jgi:hypothetical protein
MKFQCPIPACRFHKKPETADFKFCKNHLAAHDMRELQQAAFKTGIITSQNEFRPIWWLVQQLTTKCGSASES